MRIKSKGRIAAILAVLIAVMVALLCFGFGRTALQASAAETNLYNIRFDYTAYRGIYISTATVVQASGTNVLESEEIQSTKNANNKLKLAFQIYGTSYSSPANLSNGGYIGSNTVNIATNSTFSKHTFEIKNIGKMERIGLMPSRCIVPVKLWRKNDQRGRAAKNETVYRMSWAVVRNLYLHGEISGKVAERLNRKNAEKTGNMVIPVV